MTGRYSDFSKNQLNYLCGTTDRKIGKFHVVREIDPIA
jgi:hypothetical protein